jgi:hypothetical protein
MTLSALLIALHILAAVVWVGGMFFAHVALRPSIGSLEPPSRLTLMNAVLGRFFTWVWAAVIILPVSGYIQVFVSDGDLSAAAVHVHVMQAIGWVMIVLFFWPLCHSLSTLPGGRRCRGLAGGGGAFGARPPYRRNQPVAWLDHGCYRFDGSVLGLSSCVDQPFRAVAMCTSEWSVRWTGHLSAISNNFCRCASSKSPTNSISRSI